MKKKIAACLGVLLTAGMVLSACGKNSNTGNGIASDNTGKTPEAASGRNEESGQKDKADSGEQVTLRMSFWADEADLAMWNKGIEAFEEDHPGVNVELESTGWNDYWTKLNTQVATGAQADIIGMVSMYSQGYIKDGALYDFSGLAEKDGTDLSVYWDNIMLAYQDGNGGLYCLPYDLSTNLMEVNLDKFEEAGIEYDPEGYTREEFVEICKKLTKDGSYALYWYPRDWAFYDMVLDAGLDIFDDAGNLCLNTPEIIELTQWLADLYLVEGVMAPFNASDNGAAFSSGLVAMAGGTNPEWVAAYNDMTPEGTRLDVMRYPFKGSENRKKLSEGGSFAISSKTQYPELCWEFLSYYCSAENLEGLVAQNFRGIPGVSDAVPTMLASERGVEHASLFTEPLASLDTSAWITFENRTEIDTEMARYLEAVYVGDMTAEEALNELQGKIESIQQR